MAQAETSAKALEQLWSILEKFHAVMLVSHGDGGMHARPMAPIWKRDAGEVWFLTSAETAKMSEIAANPDVAITAADSNRFAAINGRAALVDDRAVIRDLWNPGAQAYYPGGPEDPDIVAIRLTCEIGEYWDGPSMPVQLVKMGLAIMTGKSADSDGDTAKLDMVSKTRLPQH